LSILVTGGAGFIGCNLVRELLRMGQIVVIIDNFSTGSMANIQGVADSRFLRVINGDIRDSKIVNDAMKGVNAVVHLAALVDVAESMRKPLFTNDVNVRGTVNVLDSCCRNDVKRFVFASSAAVYGDGNPLPLREDYEPRPLSPYAESKVAAEHQCEKFSESSGMICAVLRFFNVYGPGQRENSYAGVITKFIKSGLRGERLTIYGDGTQTRDFIYVEDVVKAIVKSLALSPRRNEIFNVCTGSGVSVNDVAEIACRVFGKYLEVHYVAPRAGDIMHSYGDPEKAEKVLGFKAEVFFEDGFKQLINSTIL
jgi:nucleoside-diphosphate-sugar epimerase